MNLLDLSDRARQRVAQAILRDWKSYPEQEAQQAFVLLEVLRQNTYLYKANVILPKNDWVNSYEKLEPVANVFERWNKKYRGVPLKKRPDPLKGTPYSIIGP